MHLRHAALPHPFPGGGVVFLDGVLGVGAPGGIEVHHPRKNAAMRIEGEVVGVERFRCLVIAVGVQENGAKDGALGFNGGGQTAFDIVVSGGQGLSICA